MKNIELLIFQTLVFMLNVLISRSKFCPLDNDFQRSYVGLSLSPVYGNPNHRKIKIIWWNEEFRTGDKIFLFAHSGRDGFHKLYEVIPTISHGFAETRIEADFNSPSLPLFVEQCRKYYVAWIRDGYIRDINCLSNQPTWMFDRRHILGSQKLANLFIPGTQNSGAYEYKERTVWDRSRKFMFNPSAQDLDVMTQLVQGIRYIHVQVGYHPENTTVWWVHKMSSPPLIKLDTLIDHVKMFLQFTQEIVLIDLQNFPFGFRTKQNCIDLMNYVQTRFGTFLMPVQFNWDTPLRDIWNCTKSDSEPKMGKVLLNFNFEFTPFFSQELKGSFIRYNSIKIRDFEDYFEALSDIEVPKENMTSNSLLRATFIGFKRSISTTTREIADYMNPDITIWYHEFWYRFANIVALDFFEASGIVDIAIKSNEFRYRHRRGLNGTRTENCTLPDPQSLYSPEYTVNNPSVMSLLTPRIVEGAVNKIYGLLPVLKRFSPTKPDCNH